MVPCKRSRLGTLVAFAFPRGYSRGLPIGYPRRFDADRLRGCRAIQLLPSDSDARSGAITALSFLAARLRAGRFSFLDLSSPPYQELCPSRFRRIVTCAFPPAVITLRINFGD